MTRSFTAGFAILLLAPSLAWGQAEAPDRFSRHRAIPLPADAAPVQLDSAVFTESFDGQIFPPAGWTAVNRDGSLLPAWFQGTSTSAIPPFDSSGFAADNFQGANGSYLDDYLITPLIPGIGAAGFRDSLVFYARSVLYAPPVTNIPDSLMILVSLSGTDTSSFTYMLDYITVSKGQWTRMSYTLTGIVPPNADVHVAFRYLHYAGGPSGTGSDFVGIDRVQVTRSATTGVMEQPTARFELKQNYPNPFNPVTTIKYTVGVSSGQWPVAMVRLLVYDMLGREVAILVDGPQPPGIYSVQFDGSRCASGVYICRMSSGAFVQTQKLVLLR